MNFDDNELIRGLDISDMMGEIKNLPDQMSHAWALAEQLPLPEKKKYTNVVIAGMGGSAIGADILAAYVHPFCEFSVTVIRGYELPAWAAGEDVLVICSSHSGNTEETLAVFSRAIENSCAIMTISTGGFLLERSQETNNTAWIFEHAGQPRAAVGLSFGLLLNLFSRMGWVPDQKAALDKVIQSAKHYLESINESIPSAQNHAKRIAGQAVGRFPLVMAAEHLEPVARRWKTQLNELAKCSAFFEFLPEADHNTLAGLVFPESSQQNFYSLFLDSENYNERNQKRMRLTHDEFMVSGFCTDRVQIEEKDKLSEIWKMILLGDFVSFYLAIAYGVDPTPVEALQNFKKALKS